MKAVDTSLLKLLKAANQFVVPIYQRTYSWDEPECAKLWSDIVRAGRNPKLGAHFTGSIVYVATGESTKTAAEPDLIIDGQQRVTTVTLLLAALAKYLEKLPEFERELVSGFSPKKIRGLYLLNELEDGERQFKLILSQADKNTLISLLQGVEPSGVVSERVHENFRYFQQRFNEPDVDVEAVCRGLEKLVVVEVTLNRQVDHPQLVFEAMNSTGKKLTQADLIRNFVLMDLPRRQQNFLYREYWRPMEVDLGSAVQQSRFDDFVRHYLTVVTGEIPRQGDIYEAFKDYANTYAQRGESIQDLVEDLRAYSKRYTAMALGGEPDAELREMFQDLEQIQANVVYPFLLEAYTDYEVRTLSRDDFLEIVRMVIAYLLRRAVCRIPTNSLNTTFSAFAKALRRDRYLDSVRAHFLTMPTYRRFPSDEEFVEALRTADLYHFKRRSYFFRVMENHGKKEHVSTEAYTIEHILPQTENLPAAWQRALGEKWKEIQKRWGHTLGNLTLTGYNSEYSNKSFVEKRDMDGGFAQSPLKLNQGLGELDAWTEETIRERGLRLAEEAVRIWSRPELPDAVFADLQGPRSETGFTIQDHPTLLASARWALFEKFSDEVMAMDPSVTRHFLKLYVAFKAETNFVDVIPQVARMRLSLNLPIEALHDERGLAVDVSGKRTWGNGATEVSLNEESDLAYILGLVRQAYEHQLGDL